MLAVVLERQTKPPLKVEETDGDLRVPPGGTESLQHFLLLLDISDWWKCGE